VPVDPASPVQGDTPLYRRINPAPHLVWDENLECWRISTGAFRDPEMSVGIGDVLEDLQRAPDTLLDGYTGQYLVGFPAQTATDCQLSVVRDPTTPEPAHGLVRGKKPQSIRRALARACEWIVGPDDGCEPPHS
jgi:hypothetical protein